MQPPLIDPQSTLDEYLHRADWRVNANSNQGYSLGGMILNTSGKVTANYWLSTVYSPAISEAHRSGDLHIHDLDMFAGYCAGWSLRALLEEGLGGIADKIDSAPPKNLSTALGQMVNFLGTLQNEWAGAQAFSSFDTYLAPFVKIHELYLRKELASSGAQFTSEEAQESFVQQQLEKYVYDCLQSFVFNLNVPSRWGMQTPFTNVTLDWTCPPDLQEKRLRIAGEPFDFSFGELQKEMDLINSCFIAVMMAGDAKGRVFTFPIPTYNITKDFPWEHPNSIKLFAMTSKYGLPYFQNFLNSDLKPHHVRSMCCRLQLDLTELLKRGNGLFGSAEMTGSIGVVTINAGRLGYVFSGDMDAFLQNLRGLMELARESLESKRRVITHWMEAGLFPYTKRYLGSLDNHFSTIGINGLNEAVMNFFRGEEDIVTERGKAFATDVLLCMREELVRFQEETGNMYNLEASPAEGATYRFAKEDAKRYPGILQAGTRENPYYTNSSQLPVEYTEDIFAALDHQDSLQRLYTGGTVLHLYLGERIHDPALCGSLIRRIFERYTLPYITISPTFSICPKHGYLDGEHDFCPTCDQEAGLHPADTLNHEVRQAHSTNPNRFSPVL